jgi:hypothetical protein
VSLVRRTGLSFVLLVAACGGSPEPPERPRPPPAAPPLPPAEPEPALAAWELARVPEGTFGPYLGERGDRSVVLWAAHAEGRRGWFVRALDGNGEPLGEPSRVAEAPAEVGLVAVRPLGADEGGGFVVVSTSREFSGERVDVLALGPSGRLAGGPTPLVQSQAGVIWVDAVRTREGALVFWAVKHKGSARLHAVEVGRGGQPRTAPKEVLAAARAWQVAPLDSATAIAAVTPDEGPGRRGGQVVLAFATEQGNVDGQAVLVSASRTAEPDLDMVPVGDRVVLAWSDHRDLDARLFTAAVTADGKVAEGPRPITTPRGPQALIRLVAPTGTGAPAFIAWENQLDRPDVGRRIQVAEIDANGGVSTATATVTHAASDGSVPELDATSHGLGVLTLAPACRSGLPCGRGRVVPTFVQLDRSLDVAVSEPVRLEPLDGAVAELTWGLSCRHFECLALAALPTVPAPVYAVQLGGLSNEWVPAARRDVVPPAPRVEAVEAVGQSDSVSDLAAAHLGGRRLVAWVTYFDPNTPYVKPEKPAPDGRREPVRAVLRLASLGGDERVEPRVLSYRAQSIGGVALAADLRSPQALVVWSALEQGEPQVFLTTVRPDGGKVQQRMLTRTKGGVSDVAAAAVEGGWLVAWVDMRHGRAEVYVARVDTQLRRVGAEQRLTQSTGNASSIRLVRRGEHVFAVWADARGHEVGLADLFAARLSGVDGSPLGPEVRLTRSRDNVHSPALAAFGEGAVTAWIEEPPRATGGAALLVVQRLDSGAEAAGEAQVMELPRKPLAVSLECGPTACHVAVATAAPEGGALEAFRFVPGRRTLPSRLVALEGEAHEVAAPVILGSELFYADRSVDGGTRIRRVRMTWDDAATP